MTGLPKKTPQVNEAKLMLLMRDLAELCHRYPPANAVESAAHVGVFLTFAATAAGAIQGLPFSVERAERLARAAQAGLNEALQRETAAANN